MMRKLLHLFWEMMFLSASVVGGGYVILSVADDRYSKKFKWIRPGELFEMLPLFQMVPGIIGSHTAIYLGNRVAGFAGAVVAAVGMVLPSIAIFLAVSLAYHSIPLDHPLMKAAFLGLRAALAGILLDMVIRTWKKSVTGVYGYVAVVASAVAILAVRVAPGRIIVAGMVLGAAMEFVRRRLARPPAEGSPRVFRSFWAIPLVFVAYGLMAFGGGFVLVPVYLRDFVGETARYLQMSPCDFANVMALTEMTPGPVAVNCATFFGYALEGVPGAVVASLCVLLPGSLILFFALRSIDRFRESFIVRGVFAGVRPVTAALLFCAAWSIAGMCVWSVSDGGVSLSPLAAALALLTLLGVRTRRVGAVLAIFLSAAVSTAVSGAVLLLAK